ncbi:hypothetical protein HDR59_03150 [bacterium]|nr:hypothetical protein [bacterium]
MLSSAYTDSSNPKHKEVVKKVEKYFDDNFKGDTIAFKWVSDHCENMCGACEAMNGVIKRKYSDFDKYPPLHPNCHCKIIEIGMNEDELDRVMKEQEERPGIKEHIERVDIFIDNLLKPGNEGVGYSIVDQPTNSGITQKILDVYIKRHPEKKLTVNLKTIGLDVIKDIYKECFYYDKKLDKIKNDRIAYAIFDMGVMTSPDNVALIVQNSLNEYGLKTDIDGIMGKNTRTSLNKVNDVEKFMDILIKNRIDFLNRLPEKDKWKGWFPRTRSY